MRVRKWVPATAQAVASEYYLTEHTMCFPTPTETQLTESIPRAKALWRRRRCSLHSIALANSIINYAQYGICAKKYFDRLGTGIRDFPNSPFPKVAEILTCVKNLLIGAIVPFPT